MRLLKRQNATLKRKITLNIYLSRMNLPSLYFWFLSCAASWNYLRVVSTNVRVTRDETKELKIRSLMNMKLTYFHPTIEPHPTQNMSTTVCIPVIIIRSSFSPTVTFTLQCAKEEQDIIHTIGSSKHEALDVMMVSTKSVPKVASEKCETEFHVILLHNSTG